MTHTDIHAQTHWCMQCMTPPESACPCPAASVATHIRQGPRAQGGESASINDMRRCQHSVCVWLVRVCMCVCVSFLLGTGAMKSGFTRTGKRTIAGVIDDGVKAVVRYYLNNYQDGVKQDAIDLITGERARYGSLYCSIQHSFECSCTCQSRLGRVRTRAHARPQCRLRVLCRVRSGVLRLSRVGYLMLVDRRVPV